MHKCRLKAGFPTIFEIMSAGAAFPVHKSHLFEYLGIENK